MILGTSKLEVTCACRASWALGVSWRAERRWVARAWGCIDCPFNPVILAGILVGGIATTSTLPIVTAADPDCQHRSRLRFSSWQASWRQQAGENSSFVRLSVCFVVLVNDKSTTFLCICSQNVSKMITAPGRDTHQLCVVIRVRHQAAPSPLQVASHLFRNLSPGEIPPSLGHHVVSSQVDKTAARAF